MKKDKKIGLLLFKILSVSVDFLNIVFVVCLGSNVESALGGWKVYFVEIYNTMYYLKCAKLVTCNCFVVKIVKSKRKKCNLYIKYEKICNINCYVCYRKLK